MRCCWLNVRADRPHYPLTQGGVRLGTPAMTTRGFVEKHFKRVADMLHRCVKIAKRVESRCASNKLTDLKAALEGDSHVEALRSEVRVNHPSHLFTTMIISHVH